jgi:predicted secreted Zn-dependent protease
VRLKNPRVAVTCAVDMPRWNPRNPAMKAAWRVAWTRLRAHEAEHEAIGREHRTIMEEVLKELDIYSDATDRADAVAQAQAFINDDLARLEKEQQDAQDAIDPFRPPFDCPDEETEAET